MSIEDEIELIMLRWRKDYYKRPEQKPNEDTKIAIAEIKWLFEKERTA